MSIFYLVINVLLIALGILSIVKRKKDRIRCSRSAVATITDGGEFLNLVMKDAVPTPRYTYSPIYSYEVNGRWYNLPNIHISDKKKKYLVGDTIQIWYDPDNPQNAIMEARRAESHKGSVATIIFGIIGCLISCIQLGE